MTMSPAERFAAAKSRTSESRSVFGSFRASLPFEMDHFQVEGCRAIQNGKGVLVAAPTSAGKTVVGQFAVYLALSQQSRCFYTTPIKALSNQKFAEFAALYGDDNVGLLTGDNAINGDAPIVVMTTEVLRNMLYERSSAIHNLSHVVMDEVHYLADRSRGAVWEEVIIHLPTDVKVVALSATVSNAEEFGEWLRTVRGDVDVVVEEHRPTPLEQHVMVNHELHDLFTDSAKQRVNPELMQIAQQERQAQRYSGGRRGAPRSRFTPSRITVVTELEAADLLPGITFIFSRAACDDAVTQCLSAGLTLTSREEQLVIHSVVDSKFPEATHEELQILGFSSWRDGLVRGIAAHHAGMLPAFKQVVEELFQRGLIKMVFATETLSLGINMPARSVVLEKLTKWNGTVHAPVTAGEYTQLTGRAGRRGIDSQGHAVVLWQPDLDPQALAGLASARTYPLRSSFKPSYNMAINLIGSFGTVKARELLESSFAQFQADQGVVGLATQLRRNQEALKDYSDASQCHLGDFAEYMTLRLQLSDFEKSTARDGARARRHQAVEFLNSLRRGDVFVMGSGRRSTVPYVVLDEARDFDDPRPRVMSTSRQVKRLGQMDVDSPARVISAVVLPPSFDSRSPKGRNWLADQIERLPKQTSASKDSSDSAADVDTEVSRLRRAIRAHACHGCSDRDEHVRWFERVRTTRTEIDKIESKVEQRTSSIARDFDRICAVLTHLGYLELVDGTHTVTQSGAVLGRIYCELDLLVAECIATQAWNSLNAEELASAVSTLVFETRRDDADVPTLPDGELGLTLTTMSHTWGRLKDIESQYRVDHVRDMDLGFVWPTLKWARGQSIARVLKASDMPPGDFVRWSKQVVDLLSQIVQATDDEVLSRNARAAGDLIARGIVLW